MDTIDSKRFARFLLKLLRRSTRELHVHKAVLENFKLVFPDKVEELLEEYRRAPEIQALAESQFDQLDTLVEQLDGGLQEKALLEMLEKLQLYEKPN